MAPHAQAALRDGPGSAVGSPAASVGDVPSSGVQGAGFGLLHVPCEERKGGHITAPHISPPAQGHVLSAGQSVLPQISPSLGQCCASPQGHQLRMRSGFG